MNRYDLLEQMKLTGSNGWNPVEFHKWSSKSFYTYMLENDDFCLGWLAIMRKFNQQSLVKHHFLHNPGVNSSPDSLPRLLIATNGSRWFLSKPTDTAFTEVSFEKVLMAMYEELKKHVESPAGKLLPRMTEIGIRSTMYELKKAVRDKSEARKSVRTANADLFTGSGTFADDSYKSMYEVSKMRADALEKILKMRMDEFKDLKKVLYEQLCHRFPVGAIQFIIDLAGVKDKHVYVSLAENGELRIKILNVDLYDLETHKNGIKAEFLTINANGEMEMPAPDGEGKKTYKDNYFKVNPQLLQELLNNTKNGK